MKIAEIDTDDLPIWMCAVVDTVSENCKIAPENVPTIQPDCRGKRQTSFPISVYFHADRPG